MWALSDISYNQKKYFRLLVLAVFVVITLGGVVWFLGDYFLVQKVITLNPKPGTSITLAGYKNGQLSIDNVITKTSSYTKVRLHPNKYIIKFGGGGDYKDVVQEIQIDEPIEINTPSLGYSDSKLKQMLESERLEIQKALRANFDISNYQITNEKLFALGNWYSARLLPNTWYDPAVPADYLPRPINEENKNDILVAIMQKENGQWTLSHKPSVVYWLEEQPNIPEEVIRGANKPGY